MYTWYSKICELKTKRLRLLLFFNLGGHQSFLCGHWYPCFELLVRSPLDVKTREAALFALGRGVCDICSTRFTSGATPADLLTASMAVKPYSSTYLQTSIGGTQDLYLSCYCLTLWNKNKTDALGLATSASGLHLLRNNMPSKARLKRFWTYWVKQGKKNLKEKN